MFYNAHNRFAKTAHRFRESGLCVRHRVSGARLSRVVRVCRRLCGRFFCHLIEFLKLRLKRVALCIEDRLHGFLSFDIIHLRDDVRKFVTIPIREEKTLELLHEFLKGEQENE